MGNYSKLQTQWFQRTHKSVCSFPWLTVNSWKWRSTKYVQSQCNDSTFLCMQTRWLIIYGQRSFPVNKLITGFNHVVIFKGTTYESKHQVLSTKLFYFYISISVIRDLQEHIHHLTQLEPLIPSLHFGAVSFKIDFFFNFSELQKAIKVGNVWEKGDTLWQYRRTKVFLSFCISLVFIYLPDIINS